MIGEPAGAMHEVVFVDAFGGGWSEVQQNGVARFSNLIGQSRNNNKGMRALRTRSGNGADRDENEL
jgi:hypothetical protein